MTLPSRGGFSIGFMTIGEAARRSGFTVKALRFYEDRGILPPAGRRPSGYRVYGDADLRRLEFIRQAKTLGLTLETIRGLVVAGPGGAGARARLVRMLKLRIAETASPIQTLAPLRKELEGRRRILVGQSRRHAGRGYCTCLERGARTPR